MQQCESERGAAGAPVGERSSDELLPAAIQDAVAAAIADGAIMDEIVARVRAGDEDRSDSAEGSWAERMDGLIGLQRETVRCVEEWERTSEPGAERLGALIAIETLRTLALATMADLNQREEPVATEHLTRLALALHRIESADRLRIEREQAAADPADTQAGAAARAASMTHAERVDTVRRALEGHPFFQRMDPQPPASAWAPAPLADDHIPLPEPAPDPPVDNGAQKARDAGGAPDVGDARDAWDARMARDAELKRREAEGRLWPTDPPFCPAAWSGPG